MCENNGVFRCICPTIGQLAQRGLSLTLRQTELTLTVLFPNYCVFISNNLTQVFQPRIKSIRGVVLLWIVSTRRTMKKPLGWVVGREELESNLDVPCAVKAGDSTSHFIYFFYLTGSVMSTREVYT